MFVYHKQIEFPKEHRQKWISMKYKFFWHGPLSNWHIADIVIDNTVFNCMEQYMMYMKALTFKDVETADKIMSVKTPKEQKALGRLVKNFDSANWDKVKCGIGKHGLIYKFQQHNVPLDKTLTYIEASPYDRIWGIGFTEDKALANKSNWGENLLGKLITEIAVGNYPGVKYL